MESNKENNSEDTNDCKMVQEQSLNWFTVFYYIHLHVFGIMGFILLLTSAKWMTVYFCIFIILVSSLGITAGAHRLYAHRTFVATSELRFFLVLAHTIASVGTIRNWVFWHRIHHRYYGTERDPYNHKKGFFYSHVFSNLLSAPSDVDTYAKDIDMRDIDSDRFVWLQHNFYWILLIVLGILIPVNIPMTYWDESTIISFFVMCAMRLCIMTNISWLVNSAMLIWGLKKQDKFPCNDNSIFFIWKSYWLNYHYIIPWDWKSDEFGHYEKGFVTFMLKMWYELGLVSEQTTVSSKKIQEILYKITTSEITMNEALDILKKDAVENAIKEKLICHH